MDEPPTQPFQALAKIRYNSQAVPAFVTPLPGQHCAREISRSAACYYSWTGAWCIRRDQHLYTRWRLD